MKTTRKTTVQQVSEHTFRVSNASTRNATTGQFGRVGMDNVFIARSRPAVKARLTGEAR